jgi:hypothetical protein
VTVTVWPATLSVVVRPDGTSFGSTVTVTDPSPLPLAGETVAHPAADVADHPQPAWLATEMVAVPPPAPMATVVDETA